MALMRATLLAVLLVSASSFEIVSQTFKGKLIMKSSTLPTSPDATVSIGLDMELVRVRQDQHIVMDMPQFNITSTTKSSSICDAKSKRCTIYLATEIKGPNSIPKTPPTCKYIEFPTLPAPATVAKCLQDLAALAKSVSSEGGLKKYEMHMPVEFGPVPQGNASDVEVVYADEANIVKKIVADISITGEHPIKMHEEVVDMNSKAGAPASKVFDVPAEWGTCEKEATPAMPASSSPVLKSFLHCMGMGASQPTVVV